MVRPEVIRKRLNKLDEYLSVLSKVQCNGFEEFIADPEHYGSAERFLHLAVEAVTDIGNHIVADLELGTVNSYRDIPAILADKGYINHELEEKWVRMIGFWNTLVHEYIDIDRQIVYDVLTNHLDDFEELKRIFAQFL
jgi:uncharacterized protein YutE (UPF0331/DUF86 family)